MLANLNTLCVVAHLLAKGARDAALLMPAANGRFDVAVANVDPTSIADAVYVLH